MVRRQCSNKFLVCAGLLMLGFAVSCLLTTTRHVVAASQADKHVAEPGAASSKSRITSISETGSSNLGKFNGVGYERTWGMVTGVVASDENVHGLAALDHDAGGNYQYTAEFEIIAPVKEGTNSVIVVEAENRGSPILLGALHEAGGVGPPSSAMYPPAWEMVFCSTMPLRTHGFNGSTDLRQAFPRTPKASAKSSCAILGDCSRGTPSPTQNSLTIRERIAL